MKYIVLFFSIIFSSTSFAQNKFSTTIKFPDSLALENLSIFGNIGYEDFEIPFSEHQFTIVDTSYSKYFVISIYDNQNHIYQSFFVKEGGSSISFVPGNHPSFLKNYLLVNALSSDEIGEAELYKFAKTEIDTNKAFLEKYSYDFTNVPDSINQISLELFKKIQEKRYVFIRKNRSQYYSLWLFKYYFVDRKYYETNRLSRFYNRNLRKKFKGYFEAEQIEQNISGRKNTLIGRQSPSFTAEDEKGIIISSEDFKGKYMIVNFWAPWCGPCIKEMPVFVDITQNIAKEKVEIVSINCDADYSSFTKAIKQHNMNWINIPYNPDLINRFGEIQSIPQVFLIDKSGRIIYSRAENKDFDLKKLRKLVGDLK